MSKITLVKIYCGWNVLFWCQASQKLFWQISVLMILNWVLIMFSTKMHAGSLPHGCTVWFCISLYPFVWLQAFLLNSWFLLGVKAIHFYLCQPLDPKFVQRFPFTVCQTLLLWVSWSWQVCGLKYQRKAPVSESLGVKPNVWQIAHLRWFLIHGCNYLPVSGILC